MSRLSRVLRAFLDREDPRPLSPGVEALLRGTTAAEPPTDLRMRVLRAVESREAPQARASTRFAWRGLALGGVAAAVAAVVLVVGSPAKHGPSSGSWETLHEAPAEVARVRVVDDPRLDGLASASLSSLDPLQGP